MALVVLGSAFAAETATARAASRLHSSLEAGSSVYLFFVARTEDYDYDAREMIAEASIQIERRCAANCASVFNTIVRHLREAKPTTCKQGQQDVLIVPKTGPAVVYSFSGRLIKYEGRCYFNAQPVRHVIEEANIVPG